jgi:ketosteroid isomerase-like protein
MPQASVVSRFYGAFAERDAAAMAACYHPSATFEDPAFGLLDHDAACAMWAMLLSRSRDLAVTHEVVAESDSAATARWEARYTFTRTGRPVLNRIQATFTLADGLILTHRDRFSFWVWARQAFGLPGLLLGWTPWFQARVRTEALQALAAYRAKSPR